MSTHCFIGIQNSNGTIRGIYCHSDGYYDHTGVRLEAHYTDPAKIEALLALGDISILGDELGEKHDFNDHKTHRDWTKAYHRDRGEELSPNRLYNDLQDLEKNVRGDLGAEYAYVWIDGSWLMIHL